MDEADDHVVEGCLHTQPMALVNDVAVEVVDLGAPATHNILEHRRPPSGQPLGAGGHVRQQPVCAAASSRVNESLGFNAVDRLDLEPAPTPDAYRLCGKLDGNARWPRHTAD